MTDKELDELFADSPEILTILKEVHASKDVSDNSLTPSETIQKAEQKVKQRSPQPESFPSAAPPMEKNAPSTENITEPEEPVPKESDKEPVWKRVVNNVLYFSLLITILMSIMAYKQKENADFSIFGFHIYNVLTDSMKSEIPPGSFVLVKEVDKSTIQVGDDITFYVSQQKSVTHRVIAVEPDFNGEGLAFRTQGVDNKEADKEVAFAENVVGVVTLHVPYLGFAMRFVGENIFTLGGLFIGLLLFLWVIKRFIYLSKQEKAQKKEHTENSEKSSNSADLKRVKRGKYASRRLL